MLLTRAPIIAPSILSANFKQLEQEIHQATKGGAEWIHCDIMDGHFVPNISFGPLVIEAVRNCTDAFLDVHLMIEEPDRYISAFAKAGANLITVHVETCPHLHRTLQLIKESGCRSGVAINPGTSLTNLRAILEMPDLILAMTVNPGFGGQAFIPESLERLQTLRLMRDELKNKFLIEVDGGVSPDNAKIIAAAGGDVLVAGSSVFDGKNIVENVQKLTLEAHAGHGSSLK